jgi:hypothetical protein
MKPIYHPPRHNSVPNPEDVILHVARKFENITKTQLRSWATHRVAWCSDPNLGRELMKCHFVYYRPIVNSALNRLIKAGIILRNNKYPNRLRIGI